VAALAPPSSFRTPPTSPILSSGASTSTTVVTLPASGSEPGSPPPPTATYTHAIADPTRIVIPSAEVDTDLMAVGLQDDGDVELPPYGHAAWYKLGPAPGAIGPAVILGHYDSSRGRDVFYRLKDLQPGDAIFVYGTEEDVALFLVDSIELVPKTQFPSARVWSDTKEPVIRLVTCGGEYDRASGHYLANLIVYGHLAK
jgi:sortase (surface protein transpeptidase)